LLCRIGIPILTFAFIGIWGGQIRIFEYKMRGFSVLKKVSAWSEATAVENELKNKGKGKKKGA
jgi:hypothetical protein